MSFTYALRRAVPFCALALAITATPTVAFQPSVEVRDGDPGTHLTLTDLVERGNDLAVSMDIRDGSLRMVGLEASPNAGADWVGETTLNGLGSLESQSTVCGGHAVMIYRTIFDDPATRWLIDSFAIPIDGGVNSSFGWTDSTGVFRKPDVACVANSELVGAWFQKDGSDWDVKVRTHVVEGADSSPQSFNLGSGTVSKGLAIATTSTRVYVAWFRGDKLKLTRFSISGSSHHNLTKLGTGTLATLQYGETPEIGADGDRVVLAYMHRADLKVRRSTNRGVSWGSAQTLRNEPFPSEIGAFPTTVAVKGSKMVVGAVEIAGDIGGVSGKGLGYRSTDGGSSYTKVSTRSGGRIVAGLVQVGSSYRYAEAWDQSISDPDPEVIRYRRQ